MRFRFTAAFLMFLLVAGFASAQVVETVLTPDSTVYTIDASRSVAQLELSRRRGDVRETLIVPTTGDEAIESQARLAFDVSGGTLYVLWHRASEGIDEIRLASLNDADEWSDAHVIAHGADVRRAGLQMVLTHAREEGDEADTTLIHAGWWSIGTDLAPEYALIAFERGRHLSTEVIDLRTLTEARLAHDATEREETGEAVHPPLVMARAVNAVDIVFGADQTTALTRVSIEPKRISSEARMWRPSGRSTQRTGPANLISHGAAPVQAFVSHDRIVLYTPDAKFRYSIFDNGQWTPIRMIELDETVTSDHLLRELHRTVEEGAPLETKPQSE